MLPLLGKINLCKLGRGESSPLPHSGYAPVTELEKNILDISNLAKKLLLKTAVQNVDAKLSSLNRKTTILTMI